ncbi:gliding motility lipoprotein GldD [Sphingobacterium sp. SGG-5]|uniref:gliding motility lipoprotein GldD n=1 Tax=Sphingobacterium sp. SGG-5 TaxID=2710881 RepID=UPI0013EBA511|nr:gliding motility lipoprotein GldD [Sphingobacterium sp. SGG-5]NGM62336.1 gliding motility lipoprotein GldD [Sphingobacterium sp. SGG-5]
MSNNRWIVNVVFGGIVCAALLFSCRQADYSPKPRGYHRILLPKKSYRETMLTGCPFVFAIPTYSVMLDDKNRNAQPCWKNLDFPQFNARLHISYFPVGKTASFGQLTEDARTFVYKHTAKATGIDQKQIDRPEARVYGLEYTISGNTASNYQFYVSDSTDHYLRGALYFNEKPNLDSIQPVLEFIEDDIRHLIRTFRWK